VSSVKVWPANQWPTDDYWDNVEEAVSIVLAAEPDADPDIIRGLTLFEWLANSYPAGTA
jgi:hypothetical protein